MHSNERTISIWFFIGALLACYGVLIFGAGVWMLLEPPARPPVLNQLHAGIWWGALLLVIGAVYCHRYWPRKEH